MCTFFLLKLTHPVQYFLTFIPIFQTKYLTRFRGFPLQTQPGNIWLGEKQEKRANLLTLPHIFTLWNNVTRTSKKHAFFFVVLLIRSLSTSVHCFIIISYPN
jgi:hypothetical protein